MKAVLQEKLRQRRKHLGRLLRHLAPLELRLWEKDEDDKHEAATRRPRSPVASVSASTVTDCVDGERSEATSEAVSTDPHISSIPR